MVRNTERNGRFHTDWLNNLYPRLLLARSLLKEDGVLFVSINDREAANMRQMLNEVMGEHNFVAQIAWQCLDTVKNDAKYVSTNHEYILCYAKELAKLKLQGVKKGESQRKHYKNYDNDPRGDYLLTPLHAKSGTSSSIYTYTFANGQKWTPPAGTYPRYSQETLSRLEQEGRLYIDPLGKKTPQKKTYWSEVDERMPPVSFWDYKTFGSTRQSNKELSELVGKGVFLNPKPVKTILTLLDMVADSKDALVLDFYAGSATTAHAVMQLNAQDGGNRRYILVQIADETPVNSPAYKQGFRTLCDIGLARIKAAGEKLLKEHPQCRADMGVRVLSLASSNVKDVYLRPQEYTQSRLEDMVDNFKPGRTSEDILFQAMLQLGLDLSESIQVLSLAGQQVYQVGPNKLLACLEDKLTPAVVEQIALLHPAYAVFCDKSIQDDCLSENFEQIFLRLSPQTKRITL